jgi:nicotinamide mononucleotide transporter
MEIFQELFYRGFNLLEVVGFVTGVLYVVLNIRQNIWCWPVGLVSVLVYMVVFYEVRLYADVGLQVIYVALSIYGWYYWLHGGEAHAQAKVVRVTRRQSLTLALVAVLGTAAMGFALSNHTDASLPYWDSATTVGSLVGQWLTSKKILENWLVWIAVDTLYVGVYLYKGLYLTTLLFAAYLVLATMGYFAWKKTM